VEDVVRPGDGCTGSDKRAPIVPSDEPAIGLSRVPFNRPFVTGDELGFIAEAIQRAHLSGNGAFTKKCEAWLEATMSCTKAYLTHSCTAALEMAALLLNVQPGDEVILPSFTFVSTANAFVLRGAVPVFVDIRSDTLNLDETKVEKAVSDRTKAICVVHYAGCAADMDAIMSAANHRGLYVVEDAAHAHFSCFAGRSLGTIGHLGALSFHETKNLISGEGGALLVNDSTFVERAAVIREKGTNRSAFLQGLVDKYTWVDIGSSFSPSEIIAAFLWAQIQKADEITSSRLRLWERYHAAFAPLEREGALRRPIASVGGERNGHIYYLLMNSAAEQQGLRRWLLHAGIDAPFHYVPLHSSIAGRKYGRVSGSLAVTDDVSSRLLRLPLWIGLGEGGIDRVVHEVRAYLGHA